jgi:hypothetical protein
MLWRRFALLVVVAGGGLMLATAAGVHAQGGLGTTVRFAFVPRVVRTQFTTGADFRAALDRGIVDRSVFFWQHGLIERRSLVLKPIRLVRGAEAERLGGRGQFQLGAVRPSQGSSAWVEVEIAPGTWTADDQLVLEVGGEKYEIRQVLAALCVASPAGGLEELRLAPRALSPGAGIPVIEASLTTPLDGLGAAAGFQGTRGAEFLVVRSPIPVAVDRDVTTNGPADRAAVPADGPDEWRDGDRVLVRISGAALRQGVPPVVMVWKDRTYKSGPDPGDHDPWGP